MKNYKTGTLFLINKPRKPWLSGILTLLSIGMGHVYSGYAKRGIILFLIGQILLIVAMSLLLWPSMPMNIILAVLIGITFVLYCIIDAVKLAKKSKFSFEFKKYNKWYVYLTYLFITSFAIQPLTENLIKSNIVQAYKIPSGAMKPTLLVGDHIFVNKLSFNHKEPKRNDIIVFKFPVDPDKDFIKRVIGLPGDVIEMRDKKLYINQELVNHDFAVNTDSNIIPGDTRPRDNFGPITIPESSLFVMGDNRDQSFDSRFWGFVSLDAVKGTAYGIYWSWEKDDNSVRWDRIGKSIY